MQAWIHFDYDPVASKSPESQLRLSGRIIAVPPGFRSKIKRLSLELNVLVRFGLLSDHHTDYHNLYLDLCFTRNAPVRNSAFICTCAVPANMPSLSEDKNLLLLFSGTPSMHLFHFRCQNKKCQACILIQQNLVYSFKPVMLMQEINDRRLKLI